MSTEYEITIEHLDELLEQYFPFIIRTVSTITGRYVSVEHDDAFSIALFAFTEAIERFDEKKGNFINFAGLVIRSRLTSYLEKEARQTQKQVSLDFMQENGEEIPIEQHKNDELKYEILQYQKELLKFGLTFEKMVDCSPKHRDTRERAIDIAQYASQNEQIVANTYRKKKLPIRPVATLCQVSEKIVKTSKQFILGTMLVFVKKLTKLEMWIQETRWNHD